MLQHTLHKLGANVAWLIADRVVRMAVGVVVLGVVARYLEPPDFGRLNYAISLAAIFASVASLGIEGIVIRELVRQPDKVSAILGTAWVMRVIGALLALGLVAMVALVSREGSGITALVLIVGLAFLPQSFDVIDLWFQKNIQSKFTVLAKLCALLVGAAVKLTLVRLRAPLSMFAAAVVLDALLYAVAMVAVFQARGGGVHRWRPCLDIARGLLSDSWPLIFSGLLVAVYTRVEQVLVMNLLGEHSAGVYLASVRLTEMWSVLPGLLLSTLYPLLVDNRQRDAAAYGRQMQRVFDLLTGLGFAVSLGVTLSSHWLIRWIYGPAFHEAGAILLIQAWTAPFAFSGAVRAYYFLMERLTLYHTWSALLGIAVNVVVALWLMPSMGAAGAAMGALIGYGVSAYFTSWLFGPLRPCAAMQTRAFLIPLRLPQLWRSICRGQWS